MNPRLDIAICDINGGNDLCDKSSREAILQLELPSLLLSHTAESAEAHNLAAPETLSRRRITDPSDC